MFFVKRNVMKKIDLDSIISNEHLNNELKNTFEKIKSKAKNNNIILKNLDKNRNINEQLIDTFNGEISNLITKFFFQKTLVELSSTTKTKRDKNGVVRSKVMLFWQRGKNKQIQNLLNQLDIGGKY